MFRAKKFAAHTIGILVLTGGLAACGDDSSGGVSSGGGAIWVDQVFVNCGEMQAVPRNMMATEVEETHWPALCGTQGKTYADEWRCEGERIQIKCE